MSFTRVAGTSAASLPDELQGFMTVTAFSELRRTLLRDDGAEHTLDRLSLYFPLPAEDADARGRRRPGAAQRRRQPLLPHQVAGRKHRTGDRTAHAAQHATHTTCPSHRTAASHESRHTYVTTGYGASATTVSMRGTSDDSAESFEVSQDLRTSQWQQDQHRRQQKERHQSKRGTLPLLWLVTLQ